MCGRYSQGSSLQDLQERFGFDAGDVELKARYNIAPGQRAPIVALVATVHAPIALPRSSKTTKERRLGRLDETVDGVAVHSFC